MTYCKAHVQVTAFDMCIASVTNREPIKDTYGYLYSKKKSSNKRLVKEIGQFKT